MIDIAKILKERAEKLNLKDAEVARRAGIEARTYGHYTTGERVPPYDKLIKICHVLDLSPNEVLSFPTPKREKNPLNKDLLKQAIEELNKKLEEHGKEIDSDKKAEAIMMIYDHWIEKEEQIESFMKTSPKENA